MIYTTLEMLKVIALICNIDVASGDHGNNYSTLRQAECQVFMQRCVSKSKAKLLGVALAKCNEKKLKCIYSSQDLHSDNWREPFKCK